MKMKKFYAPGPSEGGGAGAATAAKAGTAAAAGEGTGAGAGAPATPGSFLDDDFPDTLDEAVAAAKKSEPAGQGEEGKGKPAPKPTADDDLSRRSAAADKGGDGEEGGGTKKDGKEAGKPVVDEFEFEPKKSGTEAAASTAEESTWINLAKETGLGELKEDTYEAYSELYKNKLTAEREAGRAEASKVDELEQLKKHGPLAVDLYKYLSQEGNTIETFLNPLKPYQEALALDDEDLVRMDFEGLKYDKEVIDQKIETLKAEGKLKDKAYDVRKAVERMIDQKQASVLSEAAARFDQAKQTLKDQRAKEDTEVKSALSRLTHYYGGKVTQEMKDELYKKWESGEFRRRMTDDPDAVVRFMMSEEYGEDVVKAIRKSSTQEGRSGFRDKEVHNIKLPGGGTRSQQPAGERDLGDVWEEGLAATNK